MKDQAGSDQVFISSILICALAGSVHGESIFRPIDGFVPNKATAIRIAEAVLIPVYGEREIESERPFSADLHGKV
jgi:hypothetical protein